MSDESTHDECVRAEGDVASPRRSLRSGPGHPLKRAFAEDPRFVLCVACLLLGVAGVSGLEMIGVHFSKERLDLKKPLTSLDTLKILPYRLVGSDRIPKEEVEALGTEEYIRWRLEDASIIDRTDPRRYPTLFVTYYSGGRDQVPHVPEECFLGGGFTQVGVGQNAAITVPELQAEFGAIPVRIVQFRKESAIGGALVPTVVYLFSVNGKFVDSRDGVRWVLSNLLERYAYYSKVELFFGHRGGEGDPEKVLKAAEKVLSKVLPVLVHDHWPDWPPVETTGND